MSRSKKIRILENKIMEGFSSLKKMTLLEACRYVGSTSRHPKNLRFVRSLLEELQKKGRIFYDKWSGYYHI